MGLMRKPLFLVMASVILFVAVVVALYMSIEAAPYRRVGHAPYEIPGNARGIDIARYNAEVYTALNQLPLTQWGRVQVRGSAVTITLPTPYDDTNYVVVVSVDRTAYTPSCIAGTSCEGVEVQRIDNRQFRVGKTNDNVDVAWIAVGRMLRRQFSIVETGDGYAIACSE